MLRVVIDTSSLVSYVLTRGELMQRVMARWEAGEIIVLSSPQTRAELTAVLARPVILRASKVPLNRFVEGVDLFTEHTPGRLEVTEACRDPKDDKFLACAIEGNAHYVISSDHDLLTLRYYQGSAIVNPGQFLAAIELHSLDARSMAQRYCHAVLVEVHDHLPLDVDTLARLEKALAGS